MRVFGRVVDALIADAERDADQKARNARGLRLARNAPRGERLAAWARESTGATRNGRIRAGRG